MKKQLKLRKTTLRKLSADGLGPVRGGTLLKVGGEMANPEPLPPPPGPRAVGLVPTDEADRGQNMQTA